MYTTFILKNILLLRVIIIASKFVFYCFILFLYIMWCVKTLFRDILWPVSIRILWTHLWGLTIVIVKSLSCVRLFVTPWTVANQDPPSMGFSRQEYWSGYCHFLLQGIFPTQGLNPGLPHCRQMLYRLSHQGSLEEGDRQSTIEQIDWTK